MTKHEAAVVAAAAQRVGTAIAELSVGSGYLRARKVGASPPEFYNLNRVIAELEGVYKSLRAKLGEPQ